MSKQNVNEWKDFYDRILDIGQKVVAVRGSTMCIGVILWFTPTGVTIEREDQEGKPIQKAFIAYSRFSFLILD